MSKTFIDPSGDSIKVENYGGSKSSGFITVRQAGRGAGWELRKEDRLPLAAEILKPLDVAIVEGPLPDVRVDEYNGSKRVVVGDVVGEISEAERDYFLDRARKSLAVAGAITRLMAKEEAERQERLAANAKRDKRRQELAREFMGNPWGDYSKAYPSTKTAIDHIIELEEAAK